MNFISEYKDTPTAETTMPYTLYFDGASKGNPGRAGAGAVIYDPAGKEIWSRAAFVGSRETNNVAEYHGLIMGLEQALNLGLKGIKVYGDSKLVVEQVAGRWKVNAENLRPLCERARGLAVNIGGGITFEHVYREKNTRADALSNEALK